MNVEIRGVLPSDMARRLRDLSASFYDQAEQEMLTSVVKIERDSKILTPIKTGELRANTIGNVTKDGRSLVMYLQNTKNYARLQHENVFFHPRGGRDHFIEIPFVNSIPLIKKTLSGIIEKEFASL
ncbi:MAG: hypothetical protein WC936_06095 [Candidatus Nanoarchaeia archaeon]|jgi:hypothetical protein